MNNQELVGVVRVKPKVAHRVGFVYQWGDDRYLMSQVGKGMVALVSLSFDSNRLSEMVKVNNIHNINHDEFLRITESAGSLPVVIGQLEGSDDI